MSQQALNEDGLSEWKGRIKLISDARAPSAWLAVWNWVYGIQPNVWAAFIAFGAAAGTMVINARIAASQRQHDADQKQRERLMGIRRDVFLQGADGISLAVKVIEDIALLKMEDAVLESSNSQVNVALARMQVIGDEATTRAVISFSVGFSTCFNELYLNRLSFRARHPQGSGADLKTQQELNALVKLCLERAMKLRSLSLGVLVAVRAELGIPTNKEQFTQIQHDAYL